MKKVAFLLLPAIIGCAATGYMPRRSQTVVMRANAALLRYTPGESPGDSVGVLDRAVGDTIPVIGMAASFAEKHWVVAQGTDTFFVRHPDLVTPIEHEYLALSPKFRMPRAQDAEIWARAESYIEAHSDMPIHTKTENLIITYRPKDPPDIGFAITRLPFGDEVEYHVQVMYRGSIKKTRQEEAKKCAFFMMKGWEYVPPGSY